LTTPLPILAATPIPSFRPNGTCLDLARPDPCEISFHTMAAGLSKIARFNGINHGPMWAVALHCVRGADAIERETGDPLLAAWFLLHDGEEHLVGDKATPVARLHAEHAARLAGEREGIGRAVKLSWENIKDQWRAAGWQAARLPMPSPEQERLIGWFDRRMCDAEMLALFGENARPRLLEPDAPPLKLKGGIKPLAPMKAEEQFIAAFDRLIGAERRIEQEAIHAAHCALSDGPSAADAAGPSPKPCAPAATREARATRRDGRSALRPAAETRSTKGDRS